MTNKFFDHWYIKNTNYKEDTDPSHIYKHVAYYNLTPEFNNTGTVDPTEIEKLMDKEFPQDRGCHGIHDWWGNLETDTLEDIYSHVPEDLQVYLPDSFNFIKDKVKFCSNHALGVIGNDTGLKYNTGHFKHVHNNHSIGKKYSHAISAVIPICIRKPIKEKVFFQWTDTVCKSTHEYNKNTNHHEFFVDQREAINKAYGPMIELRFPEPDEILVFSFNASHWVHWVENLSTNIFMLNLNEDVLLK
jgi:hypothetical protein